MGRLIGEYPVIGIRRVIEARTGKLQMRQSIEGQVLAMAEAVKEL